MLAMQWQIHIVARRTLPCLVHAVLLPCTLDLDAPL